MCIDINYCRELGIAVFIVAFETFAAFGVISRDVSRFQAGRINGRQFAGRADQAVPAGEMNGCIKESISAPFFRRRRSA